MRITGIRLSLGSVNVPLTSFLARIKKLAGILGRDPVIVQCASCKKWMLYDSDRHKGDWQPPEKLRETAIYLRQLLPAIHKISCWYPVVSTGYCSPCAEAWYRAEASYLRDDAGKEWKLKE